MKKLFLGCALFLWTTLTAPAYEVINQTGENFDYQFNIYGAGENVGIVMEGKPVIGAFDILSNYRLPLFKAGTSWSNIVNTAISPKPAVTYTIVAEDEYNAAAESEYTTVNDGDTPLPYKVTYVNAKINGLTPTSDPDESDLPTDGIIFLGLGVDPDHPGWAPFSGYHALNHSDLSDLNSVLLHEYMHSLGVTSAAAQYHEEEGDNTVYFSAGAEDPLSVYDKDLRLYQGSMLNPFDAEWEVIPEEGMAVGENEDFDMFTYSPYLVGENTIKVLGNNDDYDAARYAIENNDNGEYSPDYPKPGGLINYSSYYAGRGLAYPYVYGMPIHPADQNESGGYDIDLSHLELHNSFMSHQDYRNWLIPMEAELAVLKDSGYDIELRKYFGKSYYLNGVTDTFTGYSQWDGSSYTGAPSDTVQAVGLHVYGNNNTITQAGNVAIGEIGTEAAGEGSFGVRIDGKGNNYTLSSGSSITTNGKENIGLGVTWGQNHQLTVESGSSVTAQREDGLAVSFDFGRNLFGAYDTEKGSYILYDSSKEENIAPDMDTRAPLVDQFNVAGTLTGGKAAIFISDNAHVNTINLLNGSLINGNIISQWNSVKSGKQATVKRYNGEYWEDVDPSDPSQIYFTQLNATGNVTVNGKIDGGNDEYNTLKLSNTGHLNVNGEVINVDSLENTGTLTLAQATALNTQTGEIEGDGTIEVTRELNLSEDVTSIENTLDLGSGALFSTLNDKAQGPIEIAALRSNGGKLAFDLGDSFDFQNDDTDDASIFQIKVSEDEVDLLEEDSYTLFNSEVLDLGTSSAHVYYDGNRYTFTQDATNPQQLSIVSSAGGELADAVADSTAANYIVTYGTSELTQDAGTVQGDSFEISGANIDVNGHSGLVIDGANNPSGTTLLTGISGASDSNLTVQNGGELEISAQQKSITLGQSGETALALSNAEVTLDSENKLITVEGAVQGTNKATDIVNVSGALVVFNNVSNATLRSDAKKVYLSDQVSNTSLELNDSVLLVVKDDYLAAAGNNQVVVSNGGAINVGNDKATDITLDKMTLQSDLITGVDVDFQTMSADRFVFQDPADLDTQSHLLNISYLNVLNSQVALENEFYEIPFVSADYNNQNFLGGVKVDMDSYTLQGPIFRYGVSFEQNDRYAGLRLARGSSADYKSYNPAVLPGPVAAQVAYLGQRAMYEQAFGRMDMRLQEDRKDPVAGKLLAATENFHGTLVDKKRVNVWANPYTSFGKVPLKNGPEVKSTFYGTAAGMDLPFADIGYDWSGMGGFYVAYNGSHQRFEDLSTEQNGGGFGVSGMAYKENFFAGLLAGGSMSDVRFKDGYGRKNSNVWTAGLAAKTGYMWELGSRGQWLLQPELLAAYTRLDMSDYTNGAGVKIHADPLQVFTLQPQLRLMGDFQKWGQPYVQIAWVGNLGDKTKFKANNVELPQFSVKPFMKYDLGIRKMWSRWGGYLETSLTSGGVRSIGVQAGVSYAL
ncbi:MAG: autotransporter outer membrane beta-barrel domain-containing protein [Elusimicrobiaceae bacterium]|nr:autotransporter outer membrane beta-barrel domain-containing protein [Elusimicrobiaceae bacterium]